jgi:hypothetical protein
MRVAMAEATRECPPSSSIDVGSSASMTTGGGLTAGCPGPLAGAGPAMKARLS